MTTTCTSQAELDAAIAAGESDIVINSPAGVWLDLRAPKATRVTARGSSTVTAWGRGMAAGDDLMNATRCRNMAKLLAYHTLRDRAGCIDDARVADAVSDIAVGVLRSMGDPALDVAQVDYWAWTQAQETTR